MVENHDFFIPLSHSTTLLGGSLLEYCHPFWHGKTRMVGLPDSEKNFEDMYNHLDTIPACDRQTDILWRHSPHYTYASRGKNWVYLPCRFKLWPRSNVINHYYYFKNRGFPYTATGNFQALKKVQNLRKTTPHYQKAGFRPDNKSTCWPL